MTFPTGDFSGSGALPEELIKRTLKGKSALMFFDKHPELKDKYNRHFWAVGYFVSTVGDVNEATITEYIKNQEEADKNS